MSLADDETGKDRLRSRIAELVKGSWEQHGRPLLLSQLGALLRKEDIDPKKILDGVKLLDFIKLELLAAVQLVRNPDHPLVWGLAPLEVESSKIAERFASEGELSGSSRKPHHLYFNQRVWAAFSIPVGPGHLRYLWLEPTIVFRDLPQAEAPKEGGKLVPSKYIVPRPPYANDHDLMARSIAVSENIRAWAVENETDVGRLSRKDMVSREIGEATNPVMHLKPSMLNLLLEALDESDLRRLSLPLDIVKKLQRM